MCNIRQRLQYQTFRKLSKESDFTPEDLAESKTIRLDNALKKVKEELNEQGIKYDSSDMKKIKNDVEQDIEKDEDIFCDEKVEQYVKNFIEYKKEQKQEQKTPKDKEDEGINRLEQILQKFRGY